MPLPSFLQRKPKPSPERAVPPDASAVEVARTRARRRLIGAVVLLAAGVIGFPLIFETQPRPVSSDVPIQVAGRHDATPAPAPKPAPKVAATPLPPPPDAGQEQPAASSIPPTPAPAPAPASTPPVKPAAAHASAPSPSPTPAPAKVSKADEPARAKADDGARAKALLDAAAPASQPRGARFIVQVGAYTDSDSVKEARAKVEKLGFTSYTQVIDANGTRRTRVRVGPFASREEADAAGAKLKNTGLPVHVLTL